MIMANLLLEDGPKFGNCIAGDYAIEPYIVAHNLILAHAAAVNIYREKYQVYIRFYLCYYLGDPFLRNMIYLHKYSLIIYFSNSI